eukprot:TRINITY_DN10914_c0_g1_i2.p1 TRINITY_DN10914_c0_g1~~TRINITY_DN10914_c0_g1_i2.p1  ORF type:complete len:394 (+),score=95.10 TRINITY_DN10914_c0_g1_i2:68-1249(+)
MEFQKQQKKWRLQEVKRTRKDYSSVQLKEWDFSLSPDSRLPQPLQETMKFLTSVSMYNNYLSEAGINVMLFPVYKLNQSVLDEALEILKVITKLNDEIEEEQKKSIAETNLQFIIDSYDKIAEMSNQYYELIPHSNFSHTMIPPLDKDVVMREITLINNLKEVSIARKILLAATHKMKKRNPLDYTYLALNVNFEVLEQNNPEFQLVFNYAINTGARSINKIYRIQRKGEPQRMEKWQSLPNHYLLWHGSATNNFIGILTEGLRIAPPEAPTSGYMFGKGLYFADMYEKSSSYCSGSPSMLLLCEVALGTMKECINPEYVEQLPPSFNSVKGVGRNYPDFNDSIVLPSGVTIPLGKKLSWKPASENQPEPTLRFNEYIVYNVSQVRMRYLVEI